MSLIEDLRQAVSPESSIPLFQQIERAVEKAIDLRLIEAGDLLPGDEQISQALGVNHLTVRKALGGLVEKGLIVRKRGVGTFVCEQASLKSVCIGYYYNRHEEVRKLAVAQGAQIFLAEHDIDLKLIGKEVGFYGDFDPLLEMERMQLTGLLLPTASDGACREVLQELERRAVPHVRVGGLTHAEHLTYPLVRTNLPKAARDAFTYLHANGHTDIGVLHFSAPGEVRDQFQAFCTRTSCSNPDACLRVGFRSALSHWETFLEGPILVRGFLETHPELTAVVVEHPAFAVEILRQCRVMGRRVPEDLSVISLFDNPGLVGAFPRITAFRAGLEEMGRVAAARLLDILHGQPITPGQIDHIDHHLIKRESVHVRISQQEKAL